MLVSTVAKYGAFFYCVRTRTHLTVCISFSTSRGAYFKFFFE